MKLKNLVKYVILMVLISWFMGVAFYPIYKLGPALITNVFFYYYQKYPILIAQIFMVCVILPAFFAFFVLKKSSKTALMVPILYLVITSLVFYQFAAYRDGYLQQVAEEDSLDESQFYIERLIFADNMLASNPVSVLSAYYCYFYFVSPDSPDNSCPVSEVYVFSWAFGIFIVSFAGGMVLRKFLKKKIS